MINKTPRDFSPLNNIILAGDFVPASELVFNT